MFAGHLAYPGASVREVTVAARASWPSGRRTCSEPGLAALSDGPGGLPSLRRARTQAAHAGTCGRPGTGTSRCLRRRRAGRPGASLAAAGLPAALHAWDDQAWDALSGRHLRLARDAGALSELPLALSRRAYLHLFSGELATAASLTDEAAGGRRGMTGGDLTPYAALGLAAVRGQDDEARALTEVIGPDAASRGEGTGVTAAKWASAVLSNGLGRYADALAAAGQASEHPDELGLAAWSQVELIEAAARAGQPGRAADALRSLSEITSASGTDWALGVEARSRALLSEGEAAERRVPDRDPAARPDPRPPGPGPRSPALR